MPVLRVILVFFILSFVSSREINPLRGSEEFVAEIFGVNLESISDVEFNQLHEALLRYKIVVVRNQKDFSVEGQRSFTKRLGRLHVHLESSSHYPGYADVNVVSNIKNSTGHYIGLYGKHVENFHSDLSW
jgi:alpha-ketoglutarate-dependent taurine dioxygenase